MLSWLTAEVDSRPLGLTRIIVGAAALIRAVLAWPVLSDLAEPRTLRAPLADWLPDPSQGLVIAIVIVWLVSATLFMTGWKVPYSGTLLLLSLVTTIGMDQQLYANHLYLMTWLVLLLTLADAGSGLSVGGSGRPVVRWPVLLIMSQLSIVYFFSAITKLNPDFLSGKVMANVIHSGLISFPEGLRTPRFLPVLAIVVVVTELFIAFFIWRANLRPAAFLLGLGLHASIILLMNGPLELFVFSLEMLAIYPLFLDRRPLQVSVGQRCNACMSLMDSLRRWDVLRVMEIDRADSANRRIRVSHLGRTADDFAGVTRLLEHLVPWLWVAPVLRIPGIRQLGARLYRRRVSKHTDATPHDARMS